MTNYAENARDIHVSNVAAGWWPENRNRGEVMMLIVSELAEAAEGAAGDMMDDKLPHLAMFDVELADTAIRLYDLIGADCEDLTFAEDLVDELAGKMQHLATDASLMLLVCGVASAMEGHRKGDLVRYGYELKDTLMAVYALAKKSGVDLDAVIAEKRRFNAVRADHRLENRQAAGGKKY